MLRKLVFAALVGGMTWATPAAADVIYSLRHNNPAVFGFDFVAPALLTERTIVDASDLSFCQPGITSPPFSSSCVGIDFYALGGFSPEPADVLSFTVSTTGPLPFAPPEDPPSTRFDTGYLYFTVGALRTLGTHVNSFGTYALTVALAPNEVPEPSAAVLLAAAVILVALHRTSTKAGLARAT